MVDSRSCYFPGTETLGPNELRISALGTGRPYANLAQANPGWLIELGNGDIFIFDFGYGSFTRFAALNVDIARVTALVATSLHTHTVGDLGAYWMAHRTSRSPEPLHVLGPSGETADLGMQEFVGRQLGSYEWDRQARRGILSDESAKVVVSEYPSGPSSHRVYDSNGVTITSFPAVHLMPGPASLRLDWNGISIGYSGATAPNRFLVDNTRGVNVLIHECFNTIKQLSERTNYSEEQLHAIGSGAHTQPHEAGMVFDAVRPELAIAYHFSNDISTCGEIRDEIRRNYQGPLHLAEDLMVVNVTPESAVVRTSAPSAHSWQISDANRKTAPSRPSDRQVLPQWLSAARLP